MVPWGHDEIVDRDKKIEARHGFRYAVIENEASLMRGILKDGNGNPF